MENLSTEMIKGADGKDVEQESFNAIYMMADSGARGSPQQIRQLAGMRGLMSKPDGSTIETPIVANFREGLNVAEYFTSTHGARKGLADTALKTASSGYLTRRLVDSAQDQIVSGHDCGTKDGLWMEAKVEGSEVVVPLKERILGRVIAEELLDSKGEVLVAAGALIDEDCIAILDKAQIDRVKVRSVIYCEKKEGICALCYGRDLARGSLILEGEAIGIVAAQSIGEPGTQLTMRTFHIGGAASGAVIASSITVKTDGVVSLVNIKTVKHGQTGQHVVVSRSGYLQVHDRNHQQRERYKLPYGATLSIASGDEVKPGQLVAEWDPHTHPVISEVGGKAQFIDFIDGVTVTENIDELTGLKSTVVLPASHRSDSAIDIRLTIRIKQGDKTLNYHMAEGAMINVGATAEVYVGDVIARIPKVMSKSSDITGGLPRVADLFEARKGRDCFILAEQAGTISFGKDTKDKRRLLIVNKENEHTYELLVPRWRNIIVYEGKQVEKGDVIVDGPVNPHEILRLRGCRASGKLFG